MKRWRRSAGSIFPELTCGLDDKRVNVYIQDGLRFLRSKTDEYDLIINDATDPFGYTEGLFTKEFYGSCYKALKEMESWYISMEVRFIQRTKKSV